MTRSSYGHSYVWRGHTTARVTHPNPASFLSVKKKIKTLPVTLIPASIIYLANHPVIRESIS